MKTIIKKEFKFTAEELTVVKRTQEIFHEICGEGACNQCEMKNHCPSFIWALNALKGMIENNQE